MPRTRTRARLVRKRPSKVTILVAAGILAFLFLMSIIFSITNMGNEKIIKGVKIGNIDVSNLTQKEAKEKIENWYKNIILSNIEAKYEEIKGWVMSQEYMSISRIQREMGVGFNRAGRFFLRMQSEGIVAKETEGNKGCPVLIKDKFYDGSVESDIPVSSDQTSF